MRVQPNVICDDRRRLVARTAKNPMQSAMRSESMCMASATCKNTYVEVRLFRNEISGETKNTSYRSSYQCQRTNHHAPDELDEEEGAGEEDHEEETQRVLVVIPANGRYAQVERNDIKKTVD